MVNFNEILEAGFQNAHLSDEEKGEAAKTFRQLLNRIIEVDDILCCELCVELQLLESKQKPIDSKGGVIDLTPVPTNS